MKLKKQKATSKGAGVVLYKHGEVTPKVLILARPDGVFDIPKGHCDVTDPNELSTAQRECFEETNIFFGMNDLLTREVYKSDRLFVFCAKTDQTPELKANPDTDEIEHVDYFWLDPSTAQEILPKYLADAILWSRQFDNT